MCDRKHAPTTGPIRNAFKPPRGFDTDDNKNDNIIIFCLLNECNWLIFICVHYNAIYNI